MNSSPTQCAIVATSLLGLVVCARHEPTVEEEVTLSMTAVSAADACADSSVADCCCLERNQSTILVTCPSEDLCAPVGRQCQTGLNDCKVVFPAADFECHLAALAERRAGTLKWGVTSQTAPQGVGKYAEHTTIYLSGTERAFRVVREYPAVSSIDYRDVEELTLQPVEYFQACLNSFDAEYRMQCIENAFVGEPLAVCVESFSDPGGL